jgi:hypothetical protein
MQNSNLDSRAESLFWFSDFSKTLNFSACALSFGDSTNPNSDYADSADVYSDSAEVYFWTKFVPGMSSAK